MSNFNILFFRDNELRDAFERYMTVVTCCLLRMYHT